MTVGGEPFRQESLGALHALVTNGERRLPCNSNDLRVPRLVAPYSSRSSSARSARFPSGGVRVRQNQTRHSGAPPRVKAIVADSVCGLRSCRQNCGAGRGIPREWPKWAFMRSRVIVWHRPAFGVQRRLIPAVLPTGLRATGALIRGGRQQAALLDIATCGLRRFG